MSGYRNSGLDRVAYEDRAALQRAREVISRRWPDGRVPRFVSETLADWITGTDWQDPEGGNTGG